MSTSDYSDIRYKRLSVGEPGLADFPRMEAVDAVRRAMARIYNFLARSLRTRYVWILEDDVFPAKDICKQLLQGFDAHTASVSAPYQSRYHDRIVAWDHNFCSLERRKSGLQVVGGNGFGCVVVRGELLGNQVFSSSAPYPDFDHEFYARLQLTQWKAKIHWDFEAEHCSVGSHVP